MSAESQEKFIGEITHYFDKIGVAVVKLIDKIRIGDQVRIRGGENTDFTQEVNSMEVDHSQVEKAGKGEEVAFKVDEKVREGYKVYRQ